MVTKLLCLFSGELGRTKKRDGGKKWSGIICNNKIIIKVAVGLVGIL